MLVRADLPQIFENLANEESLKILHKEVFDKSLAGRAIITRSHHFATINDAYCRILKREKSDILKKTWIELTPEPYRSQDLVQANRVLAGEIAGYHMIKRYTNTQDVLIVVVGILGGDTVEGFDVTCMELEK